MIKLKDILTEKKPWQGYQKHAVHGKAEVDFLNLMSGNVDWKKYNKLTDKGKNVIFFTKRDKQPLVWQTSNGREVQATDLKGSKSSYKSYRVGDIYKVLVEGKLTEKKQGYVVASIYGDLYTPKAVSEKKALKMLDKMSKWGGDNIFMIGVEAWNKPHKLNKKKKMVKEVKLTESWDSAQAFSSREAQKIMDDSLRNYAKELRKVQYKVIKDWMSKAKAGVIDFFDIYRGLTHGDIRRAHPYETDFLHKVLTKEKIIDRFRKYFGGKKGFAKRTKNRRG